jgi:hypothetical protein
MSDPKPILSYVTSIHDSNAIIEGDEKGFFVSFAPRSQLETALKACALGLAATVLIPLSFLLSVFEPMKGDWDSRQLSATLLVAIVFVIGAWRMWRRRRVRTEFRIGEGMLRITSPDLKWMYREYPLQDGLSFRITSRGIGITNLRPIGLLWLDAPGEKSLLFLGRDGFDGERLSNIVHMLNTAIATPRYRWLKSDAFPPQPDTR